MEIASFSYTMQYCELHKQKQPKHATYYFSKESKLTVPTLVTSKFQAQHLYIKNTSVSQPVRPIGQLDGMCGLENKDIIND